MFLNNKFANEERKMSKLQLKLCFSIFVLMLLVITGIAYIVSNSFATITVISIVCVLFAFLIKEPASTGLLKKIKINLLKETFRLELERGEKPHEMTTIIPESERPLTSNKTNKLFDKGRDEFNKGNYKLALEIYNQVDHKDNAYWAAKINEMLSLVRLKEYDLALSLYETITKDCDDKKFLAQANINKGDCLMSKSVSFSNSVFEKEACNSYQKAYQIDPNPIESIYHYWSAEMLRENQTNARLLSHLIIKHNDFQRLTKGQIEYFEKYGETEKFELTTEEKIMDWKKLILTGTLTILFNMIMLADTGVLNG